MHGLYLLWWVQEKQMSAALVAAILAAGDVALMVLEVPTGWFADRYGHRGSLILGSLAQVLGMMYCWLGHGVPGLLAASLLVALGDAFRSGADQALLYRTCVHLGRESEFQTIEARTRAAQLGAMVVLILAGGAIVKTWGFAAGWITETALSSVGLAIACGMREPPTAAAAAATHPERDGSSRPASRPATLVALMLPASFLGGAASAASFLVQTTGGIEPAAITIVVAIIVLAEAAGSTLAMRVAIAGIRTQMTLAAFGVALSGIAIALPSVIGPVAIAVAFLLGVAHPLRAAAIQRVVTDSVRARAASLASVCDMAVKMFALPMAGGWRQRHRR
jgi:MFS family permease